MHHKGEPTFTVMFTLEKFFENGKVFSVRTSAGIVVYLVCKAKEDGWEEITASFYVSRDQGRVSINPDSTPFCFKAKGGGPGVKDDALLGLRDMFMKSKVGFYADIELPPRSGKIKVIRFFWNKSTSEIDAEVCDDEDDYERAKTAKLIRLPYAG